LHLREKTERDGRGEVYLHLGWLDEPVGEVMVEDDGESRVGWTAAAVLPVTTAQT
jgi:hypothetical protein